jgi:murein L,D-transpeptidase YafK
MRNYSLLFVIIILSICIGCSAPPEPPEVHHIVVQQAALLKAGALEYAPDEYQKYRTAYWNANNAFIREDEKLRWFKDITSARDQFRSVLGEGNKILAAIKKIKEKRAQAILQRISSLENRVASLKESTSMLNEARLLRKNLSKAEVLLSEAEFLYKKGDFDTVETKLSMVNSYSLKSMATANSILSRYMDRKQVAKWRNMAEATIDESKRKGIVVFIVSKIDNDLIVYKKGKKIGTYDIGLGRNALKDKLYSGDSATPEGRYYVVKKNANSRYYKALLFDYPNNEDRIRFNAAKKKGLIPARTGIGSLLEIHGGGSDGMTRGCISLENNDMDKIYSIADEGTPITIVGAVNGTLEMLSSMKND